MLLLLNSSKKVQEEKMEYNNLMILTKNIIA